MPKAIVLYIAGDAVVEEMSKGVVEGLIAAGVSAEVRAIEPGSQQPIPLASYDFACIGSSVTSFFGGKIDSRLAEAMPRFTRFAGKSSAAFVIPRIFGTSRALRNLMEAMERQGAVVRDFAALRMAEQARQFGERIAPLAES